jgi:hypothetical protein
MLTQSSFGNAQAPASCCCCTIAVCSTASPLPPHPAAERAPRTRLARHWPARLQDHA